MMGIRMKSAAILSLKSNERKVQGSERVGLGSHLAFTRVSQVSQLAKKLDAKCFKRQIIVKANDNCAK
jgi:hypothetical protein